MKLIYLVVFFIAFSTGNSFSQIDDNYITRNNRVYTINSNENPDDNDNYFLEGEWNKGVVNIDDKTSYDVEDLRVNLNTEIIEIKGEKEVYAIEFADISSLQIITYGGTYRFIYRDVAYDATVNKRPLIELVSGDVPLYKFTQITKSQPNYNPILGTGKKTARIKKKSFYYFTLNGKVYDLAKKKKQAKKDLSKIPGAKSIMEKHDINPKKETDLIKLFKKINTKT